MKGSAFIKLQTEEDSSYEDIFSMYGVSFFKGSYLKLLNTSKAKEYVKNESRLEHGTRYLASPQYAKRGEKEISLDILLEADSMTDFVSKYESFTDRISSGLFFLKIPTYHRIYKLVYSDITTKQEFRGGKATFTLRLIEPNPKDRIVIQ